MKGKSGEPTPEQIEAEAAKARTQKINNLVNVYGSYSAGTQ
jgi:hypothetical protein